MSLRLEVDPNEPTGYRLVPEEDPLSENQRRHALDTADDIQADNGHVHGSVGVGGVVTVEVYQDGVWSPLPDAEDQIELWDAGHFYPAGSLVLVQDAGSWGMWRATADVEASKTFNQADWEPVGGGGGGGGGGERPEVTVSDVTGETPIPRVDHGSGQKGTPVAWDVSEHQDFEATQTTHFYVHAPAAQAGFLNLIEYQPGGGTVVDFNEPLPTSLGADLLLHPVRYDAVIEHTVPLLPDEAALLLELKPDGTSIIELIIGTQQQVIASHALNQGLTARIGHTASTPGVAGERDDLFYNRTDKRLWVMSDTHDWVEVQLQG